MLGRAFVVGISGIPGTGKTTLIKTLAGRAAEPQVVYYDQFQSITMMTHQQVREWFQRGGDPNEFPLNELLAEITRCKAAAAASSSTNIVLFETPFGRLHRATGAMIDFSIWIDVPLDIALARATFAFLEVATQDRSPQAAMDFIRWQTQYMANYPFIRPMYVAQREKIIAQADLVLDGHQPPAANAELLYRKLSELGAAI